MATIPRLPSSRHFQSISRHRTRHDKPRKPFLLTRRTHLARLLQRLGKALRAYFLARTSGW